MEVDFLCVVKHCYIHVLDCGYHIIIAAVTTTYLYTMTIGTVLLGDD